VTVCVLDGDRDGVRVRDGEIVLDVEAVWD
jgi:hypothetical protein